MKKMILVLIFLSSCAITPSPYQGLNLKYGPHGEYPINKLEIKQMTLGGQFPDYLIHCDYVYEIDENYRQECKSEIDKFLKIANRAFFPIEKNMRIVANELKVGGFCADTFIPGREALDCYENLYAELWVTSINEK